MNTATTAGGGTMKRAADADVCGIGHWGRITNLAATEQYNYPKRNSFTTEY